MYNFTRVCMIWLGLEFMLIFNFLATLLPLNDRTTQQLAYQYPVWFLPAGYVFSIWGVIYIALIAYTWEQTKIKRMKDQGLHRVATWLSLNFVANGLWIILWHYQKVELSVLMMIVILLTLVFTYHQLGIGKRKVDRRTKLLLHLPISIYLGWISVATIANLSVALYKSGFSDVVLPDQTWAALMVVVAFVLALLMLVRRNDYAFLLVVVWASFGIYINFKGNSQATLLNYTSLSVALLLLALAGIRYYRSRMSKPQE